MFQAEPFLGAAAGVIGAEVGTGSPRRPRLALADAVLKGEFVPVAAKGLVLFAGMSWMIVPFLASWVMANIVPLLSTAFATRGEGVLLEEEEEPVERGFVEDSVAFLDAAAVGFDTTVAMVVFEDWNAEETPVPVALATPGAVVLVPKRETGPRLLLGEGVRVAFAATIDDGRSR